MSLNFRKNEGASKEIQALLDNFPSSKLFNISLNRFYFKFTKKEITVPLLFFPLLFLLHRIWIGKGITHIFTSLGDTIFLKFFIHSPTIITGTSSSGIEKIRKRVLKLRKVSYIIVESKMDLLVLRKLGVDHRKIKLVYPFSDLKNTNPNRKRRAFTVSFASSPLGKNLIENRGVYLLLDTAKRLPEIEFRLYWRRDFIKEIKQELRHRNLQNVILIADVKRPEEIYENSDVITTPFKTIEGHKSAPNSIIESISMKKPVLVSTMVGISRLVHNTQCGLVFEPNPSSLAESIKKIRRNYSAYKNKCRPIANRFTKEKFIRSYQKIYSHMT